MNAAREAGAVASVAPERVLNVPGSGRRKIGTGVRVGNMPTGRPPDSGPRGGAGRAVSKTVSCGTGHQRPHACGGTPGRSSRGVGAGRKRRTESA